MVEKARVLRKGDNYMTAELQKENSMLIRLEQRGFIRRVPHQARGIELTVNPDWIPPLDRPFRLWH